MSSTRSPKNIQSMVSESKQDVNNMIQSLEKLKGLSHDDKYENALLRSRIDEQCQLICILKQRADESLVRAQTLERVNKELEQFRQQAQRIIDVELKKNSMLEMRFNDLAENHEEIIRFKDEYKEQNKRLRMENAQLIEDNKQLFSTKLLEKDEEILILQKQMKKLEKQCTEVEKMCRELKLEVTRKENEMIRQTDTSSVDLLLWQQKMGKMEQHVKEFEEENSKLKMKGDTLESSQLLKMEKLMKERDELLQLSMQRGKLVQEKQKEIRKFQNKVLEAEKEVSKMADKFEREAASVSSNIQVIRLRNERDDAEKAIKQLRMEYEAFRKHIGSMLEKERQLNAQLRNLVP